LDELHRWLMDTVRTLPKKSELAGAIRYALSRWTALTRYRDDGRIEIDNTAAERALRSVALGRKYGKFGIMKGIARWCGYTSGRMPSSQNDKRPRQSASAMKIHPMLG
jgi:hypothetical protein